MRAWLAALAVVVVASLLAACGKSSSEPTPTLAPPTPTVRHTGLPEIDAIIDAVHSGIPNDVRSLIAFQEIACTATPQGIGPLYCFAGEPDGTVLSVVPVAQCEGFFLRSDPQDNFLGLANPAFDVFAVYRSGDAFTIVFSRIIGQSRDVPPLSFKVEGGLITSLNFGCGDTLASFVARVQPQDFVLPPP